MCHAPHPVHRTMTLGLVCWGFADQVGLEECEFVPTKSSRLEELKRRVAEGDYNPLQGDDVRVVDENDRRSRQFITDCQKSAQHAGFGPEAATMVQEMAYSYAACDARSDGVLLKSSEFLVTVLDYLNDQLEVLKIHKRERARMNRKGRKK